MKGSTNVSLMLTGGLDSTVLLYWLLRKEYNIFPIYINYGQHASLHEIEVLNQVIPSPHLERLNIIELNNIYNQSNSRALKEPDLWKEKVKDSDIYLPYRNMLLISSALALSASISVDTLYAGFINTNDVKEIDSTESFLDNFQSYANTFGNVKIKTPFKNMNKKDVWELGIELNAPIHLTFSCQLKSKTPCGACPNCVERNKALFSLFE